MTNWTPAQQAAIEDRGGGLLVSAAAGSGKTAVLTERAVRLIADPAHPIPADKLLIVTFTNAAAAELRARIGESLLRRSQADPASGWLRRQQMLLQRAPICTIDAFCLDLLRRHFEALDIPPDFAPADAGSVQALREDALADTLEAACQDPDFCAFADLYGLDRKQALLVSASFGAGIGRLRETCGTLSGVVMLAGLETGSTEGDDRAGKSANYAVVQDLVARFRAEHGSSICRELLGLRKGAPTPPMADERTAEYYKKRPCAYMVESAARLYARFLTERAQAGIPLRAKMEE